MTRAKNSLIIIKRQNPKATLFDGIECAEFGALENEITTPPSDEKGAKDELAPFEKVPRQEKPALAPKSKEIHFGNAFHYFMQHLNFDGANFSALCKRAKSEFRHFLSEQEFDELFKRAQNLLENDEFLELLKGKTLYKERNLSFEGELKQLDLLCVDENEAIVVDYKTGSSDRAGNEAQVSLYKRAVEQILGLKTRAFVVYCLNLGVELCEIKK